MTYCSIVLITYLNCIADLEKLNQQRLEKIVQPITQPELSIEYYTPEEFIDDEKFSGILAIKQQLHL